MLNPPASTKELHILFSLWKKLLGFNQGDLNSYDYQLEEYTDLCEEEIPQGQLGRINDVREVGDSKPLGNNFALPELNGDSFSYIASQLSRNSDLMQPYEDFFNEKSQNLRTKIHIKNENIDIIVEDMLKTNKYLRKALTSLFHHKNSIQAASLYNQISLPESRSLDMKGILSDNFILEKTVGLSIIENINKDPKYLPKLSKLFKLSWNYFYDKDENKDLLCSNILTEIDFDKSAWKYSLDEIKSYLTSEEDLKDPFMAAHLMQNLVNERKSMYNSRVVKLLNK